MLGNLGFLFVCLLLIACRHFAVNKGLKLKKEKYLRFSIGLADLFPQAGMGDSVAAERLAGRAAFSGGGAGQQKEEGQVPGNRTPRKCLHVQSHPLLDSSVQEHSCAWRLKGGSGRKRGRRHCEPCARR